MFVWDDCHRIELYGGFERTTSARAEIWAVIEALEELRPVSQVTVVSDSSYLVNAADVWVKAWAQNGWCLKNGKPVKNADLWARLLVQLERHYVKFVHVKGHSGAPENERANELARTAAKVVGWPVDEGCP